MKKRVISLLLALAMLATMLPGGIIAGAETVAEESSEVPATVEIWEYAEYSTGIEVTKYNGTASDIYVPATLDGKTVLKLGDSLFENNDAVNSVTLAEGITEIGAKTFYDADQLVCIVTSESLTTIGAEAFYSCDSFNSVILYDAVTTIGENAFAECPNLTIWCNEGTTGYTYATENSIPYEILNPNASPETYVQDGITYYIMNGEAYAIGFDESTNEVTVPAAVSGYPVVELRETFRDFSGLLDVDLPETIKSVGDYAFYGCGNLTGLVLPERVTNIGDYAFYGCTQLEAFSIPSDVNFIGAYAFYNCRKLGSQTIPEGVQVLGDYAFSSCVAMVSVALPDSLISIGNGTFKYAGLESITIPRNVNNVGRDAFANATALRVLTVSAGSEMVTLGQSAFEYCSSLEEIYFERSAFLGDYLFGYCNSIRKIVINANLYSNVHTFLPGNKVEELIIGEEVTDPGFVSSTPLLPYVEIPQSVNGGLSASSYKNSLWVVYEGSYAHTVAQTNADAVRYYVKDAEDSQGIVEQDGIYYYISGGEATAFSSDASITKAKVASEINGYPVTTMDHTFYRRSNLISVELPDSVDSFSGKVFCDCDALTEVTISQAVTKLPSSTFSSCKSLIQVSLPSGITEIGDEAFVDCTSLQSVVLPDTLTAIGAHAFAGCTGLTVSAWTEALQTLGTAAFKNCDALTVVQLPDGVVSIGENAFADCDNLTSVTLGSGVSAIPSYAFNSCDLLTNVEVNGNVVSVGDYAFADCKTLTDITLPDTVTEIGAHAFENCSTMSAITLPKNLTCIDAYVFRGCIQLSEIYVGDAISSIGDYAFSGCTQLAKITLPDAVTTIGTYAFNNCANLKEVGVGASLSSIGDYAFAGCTQLAEITLPDTLTVLGSYAFSGCTELSSVTVPGGAATVNSNVFLNCTNLREVVISSGVTAISADAFKGCTALDVMYLPDTVTSIATASIPVGTMLFVVENSYAHTFAEEKSYPYVFWDGENLPEFYSQDGVDYAIFDGEAVAVFSDPALTSVTIPATVENYPVVEIRAAFKNCTNLQEIVLPEGLKIIGVSAFYGCTALTEVDLPSTVTEIRYRAFAGCTGLTEIVIPEGVTSLADACFASCTSLVKVDLPDTLVTLEGAAFRDCSSLSQIVLPDGLTTMRRAVFAYCTSLTQINIPVGVTTIPLEAFYGCTGLVTVSGGEGVTVIEGNAFQNCTALKDIQLPVVTTLNSYAFANCDALTQITLPNSLQTMGAYAFSDCDGLTEIVVPGSLQTIGNYAFQECDGLLKVTFEVGITTTSENMFYNCDMLKEAVLNDGMTQLAVSTFYYCRSLKTVNLPDTLKTIGGSAFRECDALTEITIPGSVKTLGRFIFRDSNNLKKVTLMPGVPRVADYMFDNCVNLEEVVLPNGLTRIETYAFYYCPKLAKIEFPQTLQFIGQYAFQYCSSLDAVTIPASVTSIQYGAFYYAGISELVIYGNTSTQTSIANAFSSVGSIEIIGGTVSIGTEGFSYMKPKSLRIEGASVSLGKRAFWESKLEEVYIDGVITSIGEQAFAHCTNLKTIKLTEGTKTIAANAFYNCELMMVFVPKSVTSLQTTSFASNVILLVYEGSYAHTFAVNNDLLYFIIRDSGNPEIAYGVGVSGTVSYTDGTAAAGAMVDILYDDGTLKESVTTDETGAYEFTYAEVGSYTIRVTDASGNTASTQVSVKRMNAFDVFLAGDTALTLKKGWTVSGTVSESPATVTLTDEAGNILTSTETTDGSFTLENVPNGTYIITATTENGSVSQEVTVFDGEISDLTLTVAAETATVWGYVEVEDRECNHHRRNWVQVSIYNEEGIVVAQTKSDSEGKYTFTNLPLGEYAIVAETAEMRPDHKGKGYDRSYKLLGYAYVSATEASTYQAEDIVLYEENDHTATISGKVTAHGETQNCEVIIRNVFRHEVAKYTTGKNGKYTFKNIPDGLYIITARTESDGMGYTVVAVRNGKVYGDTDITIYKSDKIKNREDRFHTDFDDCRDENEARNRRARIAEEKRFYDGLSRKEKDQLSDEYVRRLNELVEWAASCEYTADEGVTVQGGGLAVSGAELEGEQTVTFEIGVTKRDKWETSTDGVKTREDFIQHEMEDAAGERELCEYYEITMTKTVDGEAQTITSVCKDTETTGKFRITMEIPEEHRGHKHYSFIHVHHGEPVELVDLDDDPNTVTFEVDRFSTFALTYTDEEMVQPNDSDVDVYLADGSELWTDSNADAMSKHQENAGSYIRVTVDGATIEIPEGQAAYVDFNGKTANITGSGTLYGMDSKNDGFAVSSGAATVADTVKVVTDVTGGANGYRYIAVTEADGTYSFHRLDVSLKAVTLRTTAAGVYYKAIYNCDDVLSAKVKSYGVVLSLNNMPGADFMTELLLGETNRYTIANQAFQSGVVATSGSVFNIMKTTNATETNTKHGEMKIYANAYLYLDGIGILVGDTVNPGKTANDADFTGVAYSLYDVLKAMDGNWSAYSAAAQTQIKKFYSQWAQYGMNAWADKFENIDA